MAQFGKRKDGRYYPKGSIGDSSKGISGELFTRLRQQDARRSATARAIDNKIKAPIDHDGKHWQQEPNRYDIRGIDDPASAKKHDEMQRYISARIKEYIGKHKAKVKSDWDAMTPKARRELIASLKRSLKPLEKKDSMSLTKTELNRIAAAGAILEITGAS